MIVGDELGSSQFFGALMFTYFQSSIKIYRTAICTALPISLVHEDSRLVVVPRNITWSRVSVSLRTASVVVSYVVQLVGFREPPKITFTDKIWWTDQIHIFTEIG